MSKFRQFICVSRQILGVLWQLPQFLIGWALGRVYRRAESMAVGEYEGVEVVFSSWMPGGLALGNVIIVSYRYLKVKGLAAAKRVQAHEFGHCRQSRLLGWLYLPVIGLPSLCWAAARRCSKRLREIDYYSFHTERWADKLGGVER